MGKFLKLVLAVVVLLAIAITILAINIDRIVKIGVQKGGSLALGVPTGLDNASVSLLGGSIDLKGLTLGSPSGFQAPKMFKLDLLRASIDLRSLQSDEIVVREIIIDGPELVFEIGLVGTNWGTLMKSLESKESSPSETSEKKIRVDSIVLTNAKVRLIGVPVAKSAPVTLPDIKITDLRTAEGTGLTVTKLLSQVIDPIYRSLPKALADAGVLPADELRKVSQEVNSLLSTLSDHSVGTGKAVKDASEKLNNTLKGLLGGGKDQDGE